jgi:hypothetical protein
MISRLNIVNGDAAANTLKQFLPDEDVLPWRDPMTEGPFPADLNLSATSEIRAEYLAGPGMAYEQVLRDFRLRDKHLAAVKRYQQVTLWFEHDLLDQLQILQILDGLAHAQASPDLGIICVDGFPGVRPFRGLGQLDATQMAILADRRSPITPTHLKLAQAGWAAFRSPDPRDIEKYLGSDLGPLPFMKAALSRHLEEFPAVSNGLGRTDRQLIQLISEGTDRPGRIFAANLELETVLFIGDWGIYWRLRDLCNLRHPLLKASPYGEFRGPLDDALSTDEFRAQELSLTTYGRRVLANEADASEEFDRWLGGVHLTKGKPKWRWDDTAQHVVLAKA